jgi:hypothetical protein
MDSIGPEIIAYQQQIADTFLRLGLIPHAVRIEQAVWNEDRTTSHVTATAESSHGNLLVHPDPR